MITYKEVTMKKLTFISMTLLTVFASLPAFAASNQVVVDGIFKGANCMYFSQSCPDYTPQARIALEPDFVIAQPNNHYYYIDNIDKFTKEDHLGQNVRVIGTITGRDNDTIRAARLEVNKGGQYETVWSAKAVEQERERQRKEHR